MPKKILLADDSITIQKVVGITLANEDVQITNVDNGEDAIARARELRPDLVLADASMPKKDGYQVAEALKGDPATAGIPVLILAGQLEGHPDQARLAACRADGFIPKPFQSQELIDRVRKVFGLPPGVAAPPRTTAPPSVAAPAAAPAVAAPRPPVTSQPMAAPAMRSDNIPTSPAMPAAPRPVTPAPTPMAAPAPRPVPAPMAAPIPAPAPAAVAAINEADFGELSGAPASSGDQDLWNENSVPPAQDENLWGSDHGGTPPAGSEAPTRPVPVVAASGKSMPASSASVSAPSSVYESELVTNKAELANLGSFAPDDSPSGLDLDDSVPMRKPAAALSVSSGTSGHVNEDVAAALASIPPEKLEMIVREVARSMLQPLLEKIAWEVVPDLAEDIIKDELKRLTAG